ncbi:MAG TPA: hypothetical protein PL033_11970, partial [Candidatus Brocadiia bacterium]|nr:hypothetical protein [Candidatus Brocadiia bacterium]
MSTNIPIMVLIIMLPDQGLKSLGHKVPKSSVSDYLAWFEDAYFLFSVRLFDASLAHSHVNPKKVYCVDHSMVSSVSSGVLINSGHLLENLVFVGLCPPPSDLCKSPLSQHSTPFSRLHASVSYLYRIIG